MESTATKYTIISPKGIRIKGVRAEDIVGIHSLLKIEGCKDGENLFTDKQETVALDAVQIHRASINRTNIKPSMDMLFCVYRNKILLAEAKFRVDNIKNISKREIDSKITGSRYLVEDEDFQIMPTIYLLFSSTTLTPAHINELKRIFLSSPNYQFKTAVDFYNLFEH